ncbi:MAG: tetratricopeptide repeat protein [Bryobacteraceae bacterium]
MASPVKHNPGILGDEELVRSFVVRQQCLDLVLEALRENAASESSNRHLLMVGPRGIGKTMLVRRVAAELRANPEYGSTWIPVVFGEESYQVTTAGEFWLEALIHLADEHPESKLSAVVEEIREESNDSRLRERALAHLMDYADHSKKRLLLIVENLGMMSEQISHDSAWELRHTLLHEPRIMLLGSATSRFDQILNAGEAWFEMFAVHELKPLDRQESHTLWSSVAKQELKPPQVKAIRILTGGNPRLLTVLASFAEKHSFRELMEQLVHLIDDHTEYFKGHLEVLPPKERKVFVALLEQWNPAATSDLARTTRFGVNEVSALLNRLVQRGAVEVFEQKPRRKLYQASERLFNIYYLMRKRGQPSDRVRAAVSFMVMFYSGRHLALTIADLGREACALPATQRADHFLAYTELVRQVPNVVWARAFMDTPREFFEMEDVPAPLRSFARQAEFSRLHTRANDLRKTEDWKETSNLLRQCVEIDPNHFGAWSNLGLALLELSQFEEAERALKRAVEINPDMGLGWGNLGDLYSSMERWAEAEQAYLHAARNAPRDPCYRHNLGRVQSLLGKHKEAIQSCLEATEIDPTHATAWNELGIAYNRSRRFAKSERAFRRATELDAEDSSAWANLGGALIHSRQYEQAKEAFHTAIRLDRNDVFAWNSLGHLLSDIGPPEEAESVWEEALELHPSLFACSVHLLEAKLQQGARPDAILHEAERWIEKGKRSSVVLEVMAKFVVRQSLEALLPNAEAWAREAFAEDPRSGTRTALALVLAAQQKWTDAMEHTEAVVNEDQEIAIHLLINAAAAGYAKQALQSIRSSNGAETLEPLVIGLQIYLGESPQAAKELLEVGHDVAEQIRETAKSHRSHG